MPKSYTKTSRTNHHDFVHSIPLRILEQEAKQTERKQNKTRATTEPKPKPNDTQIWFSRFELKSIFSREKSAGRPPHAHEASSYAISHYPSSINSTTTRGSCIMLFTTFAETFLKNGRSRAGNGEGRRRGIDGGRGQQREKLAFLSGESHSTWLFRLFGQQGCTVPRNISSLDILRRARYVDLLLLRY